MKIIDTSAPGAFDNFTKDENDWVYNGLDCCVTEEIFQHTYAQLDADTSVTYRRGLRLQAVLLEMQLRGIRVDLPRRKELIGLAEKRLTRLEAQLSTLLIDGVGMDSTINPRSHVQVKTLLYGVLGLPVVKERNSKGVMDQSSSRKALEHLLFHFYSQPIIYHLLAIKDVSKELGFLRTTLSPDQRMRCSFNLTGTKNGRLNSSFSDYGDGTNLQNVTPFLRQMFIPDPDMIFVNIDLEQADSRNVGALCWNAFQASHGESFAGSYLDACESGDLHTLVARMAYDNVVDRASADALAYRALTFRDLSKKLGHGSNYLGKPPTMAKHAQLPVPMAKEFQQRYFKQFPCIPAWHDHTISELQTTGSLTTPFSRRRTFWGRYDEQSVINSAIAFKPQSMTGDQMNEGMIKLWKDHRFQLLIQVHDSVLFQCHWREVNTLIPIALAALEIHITLAKGRDFYVPLEAMAGYNWGYAGKDNLFGLKKFRAKETREPPRRQRFLPTTRLHALLNAEPS